MFSVRKGDLNIVDEEEAVEGSDEEGYHQPAHEQDDETDIVWSIGSLSAVSDRFQCNQRLILPARNAQRPTVIEARCARVRVP